MSIESRSRASPEQMVKFLDIMSQDGILEEDGKLNYNVVTRQVFWKNVAHQLNNIPGGVFKQPWKWCKVWADWKAKTKKKANVLLKRKTYSDLNGSTAPLNTLEFRLLRLINYPIDNGDTQQLTRQLEMADTICLFQGKSDNSDNRVNVSVPVEIIDYEMNPEKCVSDEGEEFYLEPKESNTNDINNDNTFMQLEEIESDDSSGTLKRKKTDDSDLFCFKKSRKTESKLMSIEEYQVKASFAIQKEKALQKREELRLKAIELKLREDELRLKEIEMNKVNCLTNIEEEKLKCLKQIAGSLNEFLDKMRNGSSRFPNDDK